MSDISTLKRLYQNYTKKFVNKILISVFFSLIVAGSTSAIAWLLDPAIKKLFIEKDQTLIFLIPFAIILAFAAKGISLYFAKFLDAAFYLDYICLKISYFFLLYIYICG